MKNDQMHWGIVRPFNSLRNGDVSQPTNAQLQGISLIHAIAVSLRAARHQA